MGRAERIHHKERLKKKYRWYWGWDRDLSKEPKRLSQCVATPKPCSCYMCQNQRENEGLTIQERRHEEEYGI